MKTKIIKIIIPIIIVLLIIIGNNCNKKQINKFEFPETLTVNNFTEYSYLDTIIMIVVNKIFNYDTINVDIHYINNNFNKNSTFEYNGYIEKNKFKNHGYVIFLRKNLSDNLLKKVISHELIHLKQIETGRLVLTDDNNILIYDKTLIILSQTSYLNRGFEIDAFLEESNIFNQLNDLIYKSKD